ncbi:sigma-54-dependent Fis family transcriptional regulator [Bacilliculturomica massiliensis]|uniref:sigma-54-dependent Fis family transcriptional regulator n=1 Tax=Bacilliculturomica massiliensis TaxID=1917867 RepID=UPI0013EEEB87|nr:sigma 54-interacting transcriptional regulator [Bacilliculturomica massiliensis]
MKNPVDDVYQQALSIAWEKFINGEDYDFSCVRPEILASWKRSKSYGVDPMNPDSSANPARHVLGADELNIRINSNLFLIEITHPYMEMIYSIVASTGSFIMLCDKDGYILDTIGDPDIIQRGKETMLVTGANRREDIAGTNAIGTCLTMKAPMLICGREHYLKTHKVYSCSCAPIFDADGNILGCLNITLRYENIHPHTMGMVTSAADGISKELKIRRAYESIELISAQRNTIIQSLSSGLFLLSNTHRIIQVSNPALDMLHLKYENVIGRNFFDLLCLDGNIKTEGKYAILEQELYNKEVNVTLAGSGRPAEKFNVSVNYVRDARGIRQGTVLRFNEPKLINRLINNISGYKAKYTFDSIIGESAAAQSLIETSRRAAHSDSNVLILGDSGTGKELIAQAIHNESSYASGPFVAINCAALPRSLVESELFGYERGAFTGANREGSPGKFELAEGGTIFLDEIGDMPMDVQSSLLRVLQTREIVRIGGKYPKQINVRIIAATNCDLVTSIHEKTFRSDLYYRLNVLTINVPSLAERGRDIFLLADYFVREYNKSKHRNITISPDVYPVLLSYSWPGNIRELENAVERAVNVSDSNLIELKHLPNYITQAELPAAEVQANGSPVPSAASIPPAPLDTAKPLDASNRAAASNPSASWDGSWSVPPAGETASAPHRHDATLSIEEQNKQIIIDGLIQCGGNVSETASLLGMNRRTFYRKLDKYNIDSKAYRHR